MSGPGTGRFAVVSIAIVTASGLVVAAIAGPRGEPFLRWSLSGWSIMAGIGVATGLWMVRVHGRAGSGFMTALGTGMLARLFVSAAGAFVASRQGIEAVWAYLPGLVSGYLPLQVFEMAWFYRKTRRSS